MFDIVEDYVTDLRETVREQRAVARTRGWFAREYDRMLAGIDDVYIPVHSDDVHLRFDDPIDPDLIEKAADSRYTTERETLGGIDILYLGDGAEREKFAEDARYHISLNHETPVEIGLSSTQPASPAAAERLALVKDYLCLRYDE